MNKWKKTLDLTPVWQNGKVPESEVHLVGQYIAKQLRKLYPDYEDYDKWGFELEELIEQFESVITLEEYEKCPEAYSYYGPYKEFNGYMQVLYDFAYYNGLWVKTI